VRGNRFKSEASGDLKQEKENLLRKYNQGSKSRSPARHEQTITKKYDDLDTVPAWYKTLKSKQRA